MTETSWCKCSVTSGHVFRTLLPMVTVCSRWGILSTNRRMSVFCAVSSGQCSWTMTQWVLFSPREDCSHSQCLWRGEPMALQEQRAPGTIGLVVSCSPLCLSTPGAGVSFPLYPAWGQHWLLEGFLYLLGLVILCRGARIATSNLSSSDFFP